MLDVFATKPSIHLQSWRTTATWITCC